MSQQMKTIAVSNFYTTVFIQVPVEPEPPRRRPRRGHKSPLARALAVLKGLRERFAGRGTLAGVPLPALARR